jgi:hypothetical protein
MARFLDIVSDGDENANIRPHLPSLASAKEQVSSDQLKRQKWFSE